MKRVMTAFFVALILSVGAIAQSTGSFTITGYPENGSAVKDSIEKQLTSGVVTPIETATREPNMEILISVVGFTSKTGSAATNDPLAGARAEGVKNFLLDKFPKATITARSKGDEANSRMVIVSWKITSPAKPQPREKALRGHTAIVTRAIGAIVLAIVFTRKRGNSTSPPTVKIESVRYDLGDITYHVKIEKHEDGWHLPFKKIIAGKED